MMGDELLWVFVLERGGLEKLANGGCLHQVEGHNI